MTRRLHPLWYLLCLLLTAALLPAAGLSARAARTAQPIVDIPRANNIVIDGAAADWGKSGFRVGVLRFYEGKQVPDDGFAPSYRLAWDSRGLLALFEVKDRHIADAADTAKAGASDQVQVTVGSWPEANGQLGVRIGPATPAANVDTRGEKSRALPADIQSAVTPRGDGYVVEALIPWASLGVSAKEGQRVFFEVSAFNVDGAGERTHVSWNPRLDWGIKLHGRLADSATPAMLAEFTSLQAERITHIAAGLRTAPELIGWDLAIADGGRILARCTVAQGSDGFGQAKATFPIARWGRVYDTLTINAGTRQVGIAVPPAAIDVLPIKALETANLRFDPYVFSGTAFPGCDFEQRLLAESLIGPYAVKVVYYDKDGNEVKTAEKPGRYGAIVSVQPEHARPMRRYRTLYRLAQPIEWWNRDLEGSVKLPTEMGIDPAVADAEKGDIAETLKWALADATSRQEGAAILLAGLSEMKPTGQKAAPWESAETLNRQWWLTLKRRLSGANALYPPITAPKPKEGAPAPVLHEGTLTEAGMKPDAAEKIDKVLQTWAADTDQGFATLVARHGVIVLHRAYGMRDGRPMTLTDKSWMASITKTLSANLLMMLVDQGLVDLDAPAAKHLLPLKDAGFSTPPTVRHLYTHTLGIPVMDHWGDEMSDLEYVIADYAPYLRVGAVQMYNGVGISLASKITEMISGEAIPNYYQKHLLGPLGCKNTDVVGSYGDAQSAPLDIATIGQMMLNRGAYGSLRFYSEETFEKMRPRPMTKVLGRDTGGACGIGLWDYGIAGFGQHTISHGAASYATLLVDLDNDLVVVMTRNTAGRNFEKYHPQFLQAVAEGVEK